MQPARSRSRRRPRLWQRALCLAVSVALVAGSTTAKADEIDAMRSALTQHYDVLDRTYRQIAEKSGPIADNLIETKLSDLRAKAFGSLELTRAKLTRQLGDVQNCFGTLNRNDAILNPWIKAEADAKDLASYRQTHYDATNLAQITTAVGDVKRNYAVCYGLLTELRSTLLEFDALAKAPLAICADLKESLHFSDVMADLPFPPDVVAKIDASAFLSWPAITLTASTNVGCANPDRDSKICDNSSFRMASKDADQRAQQSQSIWSTLRNNVQSLVLVSVQILAYKWLTGCTLKAALVQSGNLVASAEAAAIGSVAAAAVALIIAAVENYQMTQKVKKLNDFISENEGRLVDIFHHYFLSEADFQSRLAAKCGDFERALGSETATTLSQVNPQKQIALIDDFMARTVKIERWYDELFLFLSDPQHGLLDALARQQVAALRAQLLAGLNAAEALVETNSRIAALRATQIKVNEFQDCDTATPTMKPKMMSALRKAVRAFDTQCKSAMNLLALKSPSLATAGGRGHVVCAYTGFAPQAAKIRVDATTDGSAAATITVLTSDGATTIDTFHGVSSAHPNSVDNPRGGLDCRDANGQEFGTSADGQLAPALVALTQAPDLLGITPAQIAQIKAEAKHTSDLVRIDLIECHHDLTGKPDQNIVPVTSNACGIDY